MLFGGQRPSPSFTLGQLAEAQAPAARLPHRQARASHRHLHAVSRVKVSKMLSYQTEGMLCEHDLCAQAQTLAKHWQFSHVVISRA